MQAPILRPQVPSEVLGVSRRFALLYTFGHTKMGRAFGAFGASNSRSLLTVLWQAIEEAPSPCTTEGARRVADFSERVRGSMGWTQ